MLKRLGIAIFLLCCIGIASAQKPYMLSVTVTDSLSLPKKMKLPAYEKKFSIVQLREKELSRFMTELQGLGFLAASIDSTAGDSLQLEAFLHLGERYRWGSISEGNIDENFLSRTGFREKLYFNEPIRFGQVKELQQRILEQYENNGYPFAVISLKDIRRTGDGKISASLFAAPGNRIMIDSITFSGKGKVAPAYLYTYLGIRPGRLYNEAAVRKIETRLKELPFLSPDKKPVVEFNDDKAIIRISLEKRNANQFSGIIGIVPASDIDGTLLITGDVKLRLHNVLRRGELLDIQWQRLQTATQNLKVQAQYPFLFNTPIGIEGKLDFFRIDTAFFTVNVQAAVQYSMQGTDFVKVFYNYQTSRKILSEDGQSSQTGLANSDINYFGIGFQRERLDYRLNPRKGYVLLLNGALGSKAISGTPNDSLNPLDSIQKNLLQGNLTASIDGYIPLFRRFTIKLGVKSGYQPGSTIFRNELYRIGGLRTLRGFDEESIYSSLYAIGTFELRYLLDRNSYVCLFADGGYYERNIRDEYASSLVLGFGAGITFETKIGLFTANYGLGMQKDSPLDFRRSKIHFGYINYF